MGKSFTSAKSFVDTEVVISFTESGNEEITGKIKSVKDGVVTLTQDSRGSVYTYRIPSTEVLYIKSGSASDFEKGADVTLERAANRRVKVKGTILGVDDNGVVIDVGEKRGRLVKQYIPYTRIETITYAELTAEGKKRSKEMAERMRNSKGKKDKKSKLKVIEGGKKSKKKAA